MRHAQSIIRAHVPCVALVMLLGACNWEITEPPVSAVLRVSTTTMGDNLDSNGYLVSVDAAAPVPMPLTGSRLFPALTAGEHTVELSDVAGQCLATSLTARFAASERNQMVSFYIGEYSWDTVGVSFVVTCARTLTRLDDRIVFVTNRDWNSEIYAMLPDGTGLVNLTNNGWYNASPTVSPDGRKIVFRGQRDCHSSGGGNEVGGFTAWGCRDDDLYIMNVDRTDLRQIELDGISIYSPSPPQWSPDGTRLTFAGEYAVLRWAIYVVGSNGGTPRQLTDTAALPWAGSPSWSPDGTRIAFAAAPATGTSHVYVMNADGTGLQVLADSLPTNGIWSPDWSRIGFAAVDRECYPCYLELFVVNRDGTGRTQLTHSNLSPRSLAWAPDGSRIAFSGGLYGDQIGVVNADGTGLTQLKSGTGTAGSVAWSPDGRKLVFDYEERGNSEIYTVNADGSGLRNLTNNPARDWGPSWIPLH